MTELQQAALEYTRNLMESFMAKDDFDYRVQNTVYVTFISTLYYTGLMTKEAYDRKLRELIDFKTSGITCVPTETREETYKKYFNKLATLELKISDFSIEGLTCPIEILLPTSYEWRFFMRVPYDIPMDTIRSVVRNAIDNEKIPATWAEGEEVKDCIVHTAPERIYNAFANEKNTLKWEELNAG